MRDFQENQTGGAWAARSENAASEKRMGLAMGLFSEYPGFVGGDGRL